jgi:hypothetical protein
MLLLKYKYPQVFSTTLRLEKGMNIYDWGRLYISILNKEIYSRPHYDSNFLH